ncbi:hypothetical protein Fot_07987 [Forsythia ovata]|uniref:Uncharacterized protein n=1 Tax=Forsythia ovata TaxID=205694 RepID=A0ABD1WXD4_9LAMI
MLAKVKALQEDLINFRHSDEGKQIFKDSLIFKDGKQAGRTKLMDLIKDELLDINFDFLYKEGETASLTLLPESDNNETVAEIASPEVVIEPNNGICHSQASTEPTSFEAFLESTTRTPPTQTADTTVFENLQDL